MKKLLLAVLAVSGFGVAQAQSSVTVYGILDVGYSGITTRSSTPANGTVKTQTNKFDQSAEQSSRLGFKGTEDLGNGTSAIFTAEFQLYPQDATLSGNDKSGLVNRQTFVGLKKNGLGQFAVGTQYTPLYRSVAATDPGQINNTVGSIIFPANGSDVTTSALTVRAANALTVQSDSFNGARLGAMYTAKNNDTTQTGPNNLAGTNGGNTNIGGYGLNADYTYNKLFATLAYQSFKNENPTTVVSPVATANTYNFGSNVTDKQAYAAATYDFGMLKAYANWISRKATSGFDSNQYAKRQGQQIGVRGFFTPVVEGWASVGNGRYSAYGANQPTANFTGYQLGANYYLSKRTNLYGIFGSTQTSSTSNGSAGANQYAMGVRHTF
jgi:predicted porin